MIENTEENNLKETRFAYAAGLIDADGSLYISKCIRKDGYTSYDPTLMIRSTHLPTMKWFVSVFGGTYDKTVWKDKNYKDYYRWKYSSDIHAARFLDKIIPYLWIKQKQASLLKQYFEMRYVNDKQQREAIYQQMGELNQNYSLTTNTPSLPLKDNLRNAYFAGMFDGEGSSYIIRGKQGKQSRGKGFYYRACVCLGNTFLPVIQELKKTYGGFTRERPPHNGKLMMHEWDLKDNPLKERFLLSVLPYLKIKIEQSKIVLNFVRMNGEVNPEKRKAMWLACSELNGKKIESDLIGDYKSATVVT